MKKAPVVAQESDQQIRALMVRAGMDLKGMDNLTITYFIQNLRSNRETWMKDKSLSPDRIDLQSFKWIEEAMHTRYALLVQRQPKANNEGAFKDWKKVMANRIDFEQKIARKEEVATILPEPKMIPPPLIRAAQPKRIEEPTKEEKKLAAEQEAAKRKQAAEIAKLKDYSVWAAKELFPTIEKTLGGLMLKKYGMTIDAAIEHQRNEVPREASVSRSGKTEKVERSFLGDVAYVLMKGPGKVDLPGVAPITPEYVDAVNLATATIIKTLPKKYNEAGLRTALAKYEQQLVREEKTAVAAKSRAVVEAERRARLGEVTAYTLIINQPENRETRFDVTVKGPLPGSTALLGFEDVRPQERAAWLAKKGITMLGGKKDIDALARVIGIGMEPYDLTFKPK